MPDLGFVETLSEVKGVMQDSYIRKNWILIIFSITIFFLFLYFLMWFFSLGSLIGEYCLTTDQGYSLFHEDFQCRQPHLVTIGLVLSFMFFIISVIALWIKRKKGINSN